MRNINAHRRCEGVSPVIAIILMVAITVVLTGVLYVWVGNMADTEPDEQNYIIFDVECRESTQVLSLFMRTGDLFLWKDYQLRMNGTVLETPTNQSMKVGDTLDIPVLDEYGIELSKGLAYDIQLIHVEKHKIMWEDEVIVLG